MKRIAKLKIISLVFFLVTVSLIGVLYFVFHMQVLPLLVLALLFGALLLVAYTSIDNLIQENNDRIYSSLDENTKDALREGDVGIITYDEGYKISWMSPFFSERNLDHTGEKLLVWLPELQSILEGSNRKQTIVINDGKYQISKRRDSFVLFFKDITQEYDLSRKLSENAYVIGLVDYDNYDEASQSEDDISYINSNIKLPVIDYLKKHGIVYKTLRNTRMLLLLNAKEFAALKDDRFSILNTVKKEAKRADLDITLSMAFAYGSENLSELDDLCNDLLDIAKTRGGDQVAIRKVGEEAVFFGGSSEAKEKQSKVKVRVLANTLKDLIVKSSNVIIVGHSNADADCVGAGICLGNIAHSFSKNAYVVLKSGNMDEMIEDVVRNYEGKLNKYSFVSENEALNNLNDDSLVIMVDHHSKDNSNAAALLKQAKKIVIIDHHRRKADLDVDPLLVYIEAAASSTCEMAAEFLPYLGKRVRLNDEEANIMYLGIMIDTNNFKVRTSARTFDVARFLRLSGADPALCHELAEESYDSYMNRIKMISTAVRYKEKCLIAKMENGIYSRTVASQACDEMIEMRDIEAAFVLCNLSKEEVTVSARSKGNVNVQVIMEKLGGGGHMSAAGVQKKDSSVNELYPRLLKAIDEYFEEGRKNHESNSVN